MAKPTKNLLALINAGADLNLLDDSKSTDQLVELAKAAHAKGTKINILGSKNTDALLTIVKAGKGAVSISFIHQPKS